MIATVAFDRCDDATDGRQLDAIGLQDIVMAALGRQFTAYRSAAEAQTAYRRVQAAAREDEGLTLFGAAEAMRAGLTANPEALRWSAFEQEAAAAIAPTSFSIRFTE